MAAAGCGQVDQVTSFCTRSILGVPLLVKGRIIGVLEAVNKIYGTSIIVSETTRDAAGDAFCYRPLGAVAVKGKQECVGIFELISPADVSASAEARRLVELFDAALQLYLRREWTDAAEAFERALAAFPADGPAAVYLQRCHELIQTPPGADWDGVLRLEHK